MYPFLENKILKHVKAVAGISVHLISSDEMRFSFVLLRRQKGLLTIENQQEMLTSLEELKKNIPNKVPVLLSIDGWGVLVKKILFKSEDQNDSLYNSNDFEIRKFFTGENKNGYMSVIRQDLLKDLITNIKTIGAGLLGVDFGPYAGIQLLMALNKEGEFRIGNRLVHIKNGMAEDIKGVSDSESSIISIGEDIISSALFTGYAMGALFFAGGLQGLEGGTEPINEFLYKKLIYYMTIMSLSVLLFGLLTNYFAFSHYQTRLAMLDSQFETDQSLYHKLEESEKDLKQKEKLIESSGLSGHTSFAFFADRLAFLMPPQIVLEGMNFQPLEKKLKKGQEATFSERLITITGRTPESLLINDWIRSIKNEKWVRSVDMVYYGQEEKSINALFKLEIKF
jgi:hypothetical protein